MKRNIIVFTLLFLGLTAWYLLAYGQEKPSLGNVLSPFHLKEEKATEPSASGVIEATEVRLSSPKGGKVAQVLVKEGEAVSKGQKLLSFDRTFYDKKIALARAQVKVAEAALAHAQAGTRPGQIAIAEAELQRALAAREAAKSALNDLLLLKEHQQELDLQIAVAEAQLEAKKYRLAQALAMKDSAEISKNLYEHLQKVIEEWSYPFPAPGIPSELKMAPYEWWKAWANVNAAQEALEGQQKLLAHLQELRAHPQELEAQIDEARAALEQAEAAVEAAQAQLEGYRAGATKEQIQALEAKVEQAQAALDALLLQEKDLEIRAPLDGIVLGKSVHEGEVLAPGASAFILADLSQVKATVYIPEPDLGRVRVGQKAYITVDAWPGRTFKGEVTYIANEAEFTPRNVATKEGRTLTFYRVEITVKNPKGDLKPGMPADVVFEQ